MNWRDVVQSQKNVIDAGSWLSGKVARAAFPLSKAGNKVYRVGNKRWRAVRFTIGAVEFRVLILFSAALEQFQATLGAIVDGDMVVMAVLEFHGTHGDWHCHHTEEEIEKISGGHFRSRGMRKDEPPSPPPPFTRTGFGIDESGAYKIAVDFFRLDDTAQFGNTLDFQP